MCSLLNSLCNTGEEKYSLSKTILLYERNWHILQKLAVTVESCLFIHSVIPPEVKTRANELQTGNTSFVSRL